MDIMKTMQEIGPFQLGMNLADVSDSSEIIKEVGTSMPMPDPDIVARVPEIVKYLRGFCKNKYLFLTPEIALIQELGNQAGLQEEAFVTIPGDLDPDIQERIRNNIPRNIKVTILSEYEPLPGFYPSNSMIVICGYAAGGKLMVTPETYRLVGRYSEFFIRKVFVPYRELEIAEHYDNWMEISQDNLRVIWRTES